MCQSFILHCYSSNEIKQPISHNTVWDLLSDVSMGIIKYMRRKQKYLRIRNLYQFHAIRKLNLSKSTLILKIQDEDIQTIIKKYETTKNLC